VGWVANGEKGSKEEGDTERNIREKRAVNFLKERA